MEQLSQCTGCAEDKVIDSQLRRAPVVLRIR